MLRRCFCFAVHLSAFAIYALLTVPAFAADIVYPGASLATSPFGTANSLFPTGSLNENTVTVTGGTILGEVYGGVINGPASVSDNTVEVSGTPTIGTIYGGRSSGGLVSGNAVLLLGGTINNAVIGGRSASNSATGNNITIFGGSIASVVRGGQSDSSGGNAVSNTVAIHGGSIVGLISGGLATTGQARDNTVTFGNATSSGGIMGGNSSLAALDNNVTVTSGTINQLVFGGRSSTGEASGNTVLLLGGALSSDVFGGQSGGSGQAANNRVLASGAQVGTSVWGGHSFSGSGNVLNNTVQISGSARIDVGVHGGETGSGSASGNSATVSGGSVGGSVFGGNTTSGNASGNSATVSGGSVAGSAYGGYSQGGGSLGNNTARLTGGAITGDLAGGNIAAGGGSVTNNQAFVSGGSVRDVYGGITRQPGANGAVSGNTAAIEGGSVLGSVYGGRNLGNGASAGNTARLSSGSVAAAMYGGFSTGGAATGNMVEISGGGVTGPVYGGFNNSAAGATGNKLTISGGTFGNDVHGAFSASGAATGNSVELSGAPNLAAARIFGGRTSGAGNVFSGNTLTTLNVRGPVVGIFNFEQYSFFLPASLGNGQSMFPVSGGVPTDMTGTTVTMLGIEGGGELLVPGDSVVLIGSATGIPATVHATQVPKGPLVLYDFDVSTSDGTLRASLRAASGNPDAGVLPVGPEAAGALLGRSGDLLADIAADWMEPEARQARPSVYAIAGGSAYRYTGSSLASLRVTGASVVTGRNWHAEEPAATLGLFFEAGTGKYDARYHSARSGVLSGDGDLGYYGGGALAMLELSSGLYADTALRAGMMDLRFRPSGPVNALGQNAAYRLDSPYVGAHVTLGWRARLMERTMGDIYGTYLWLHQAGDTADILGESVRFRSMNEHRARAGARLSRQLSAGVAPYAGAGYEHTEGGSARLRTRDAAFNAVNPDDDSFFAEIGLSYRNIAGVEPTGVASAAAAPAGRVRAVPAAAGRGLSLDLHLKGFVGGREGVEGRFLIGYRF